MTTLGQTLSVAVGHICWRPDGSAGGKHIDLLVFRFDAVDQIRHLSGIRYIASQPACGSTSSRMASTASSRCVWSLAASTTEPPVPQVERQLSTDPPGAAGHYCDAPVQVHGSIHSFIDKGTLE